MVHALTGHGDAAVHHRIGQRPQHGLVAVATCVMKRVTLALVSVEIHDQPVFVTGERRTCGCGNLLVAERTLPDAHLVEAPDKRRKTGRVFTRMAQQQWHVLIECCRLAQAAARLLDAIDEETHLPAGAVEDHCNVLPDPGAQHTGGALHVLQPTRIGAADPHRAVAVCPDRVAALRIEDAVSLREQQRPGIVETIDPDVGLERDGTGTELDIGRVRNLEVLLAVQRHRAAETPLDPLQIHAARDTRSDRNGRIGNRKHAKTVIAHGIELITSSFDQQRIAARPRQRAQAHIVVGHVVCAPQGTPPRVEQPPVRNPATGSSHIEEQRITGGRVETIGIGPVGGAQLATDCFPEYQRLYIAEIDQTERVASAVARRRQHPQFVVSRSQRQDTAAVTGIALRERPITDLGATRTGEGPAQIVVVDERVEVQRASFAQREAVRIVLTKVDTTDDRIVHRIPGRTQLCVMAVAAGVTKRPSAALVGRQIHGEPCLGPTQCARMVGCDLRCAARDVPDAHIVQRTDEHTVAFPRAPEVQRVRVRGRRTGTDGAACRLHAIEVEPHDAGFAIDHRCNVVPLPESDRSGRSGKVLVLVVSGGQVQIARGVQPEGERTLPEITIALVGKCLPGAGVRIGTKPGLETQRAGHRQCVVIRNFSPVLCIQQHCIADRTGNKAIIAVVSLARHDVGNVVDDRKHAESVARGIRAVIAALDQQRVAATLQQRQRADIIGSRIHVRGPEEHAPVRIDQPPVHIATASGKDVEQQPIPALCIETIGSGRICRIETCGNQLADGDRAGARQVTEREGEVSREITVAVDDQRVLPGEQRKQAVSLPRITGGERTRRDLGSRRADECPVQCGIVGQRIEVEPSRLIEREVIQATLPRVRDRAVDTRIGHERCIAITDRLDVEGVVRRTAGVRAPLDQHGVTATALQRQHILVRAGVDRVHVARPEYLPSIGVDETPVDVATAARAHVEEEAFAGCGVEAPRIGACRGIQYSRNGTARCQQLRIHRAGKAEGVIALGILAAIDDQRVLTRCKSQHAVTIGGVTGAEGACGDHRAARAPERPVQRGAAGARVEIQRIGRIELECVGVALPCHGDRAAGEHAEFERGRRGAGHLMQLEGVGKARRVGSRIDPTLDDQRVAPVERHEKTVLSRPAAVEGSRAQNLPAPRVEQPPRDHAAVVRIEAGHVQVESLPGAGVEAVQIGLVGWIQRRADRAAQRDLAGCCNVEHTKGIVPCHRITGAHANLVGSRHDQLYTRVLRAVLPRVAVIEVALRNLDPTRAAQCPQQGAIRREAVEEHERGLGDREHMFGDFPATPERATHGGAKCELRALQCRQGRVSLPVHPESMVGRAGVRDPALEQQVVAAAQHEREWLAGLEGFRPEHLPATRVEKPPVGYATRQ